MLAALSCDHKNSRGNVSVGEIPGPRRVSSGTIASPMFTKTLTLRTGRKACPVGQGIVLNPKAAAFTVVVVVVVVFSH